VRRGFWLTASIRGAPADLSDGYCASAVSLWKQRAARNEDLFREVNDNIAQLEERFGATVTEPVFICECANDGCAEQLAVDLETYKRVREQPRLFFVFPGHQHPEAERVAETHPDYLVVEKTGEAGEVAEQTHS
jgi:hypothetical protein